MSATQKRINIMAALGAAVFFLLWGLVYSPAKKEIRELKSELEMVRIQIQQIEGDDTRKKPELGGFHNLNERYRWIDAKFPKREEKALMALSDLAKNAQIEILSIRSEPRTAFLDEDSQEVMIDGLVCRKMLVTIEIEAGYGALVGYLEDLKRSLPAYVTVEKLRMNKQQKNTRQLKALLDIYLYLLT